MARISVVTAFTLGMAFGVLGLVMFQHLVPRAHAQSSTCTDATFTGSYGVLGQGYVPNGSSQGQLSAVFVVTADGAGNLTLGGPNPPTGVYSVNPDCTFQITLTPPAAIEAGIGNGSALGVLVNGGKRFYVAVADPSKPMVFTGERQ
jgi:hypothetical protein